MKTIQTDLANFIAQVGEKHPACSTRPVNAYILNDEDYDHIWVA